MQGKTDAETDVKEYHERELAVAEEENKTRQNKYIKQRESEAVELVLEDFTYQWTRTRWFWQTKIKDEFVTRFR